MEREEQVVVVVVAEAAVGAGWVEQSDGRLARGPVCVRAGGVSTCAYRGMGG